MKQVWHRQSKPSVSNPSNLLKGRLSFLSPILVISLLAVVFTSGCIGQAEVGTGGVSIRALTDPPSIRSDESGPTLFIDVENVDTSQFIKVFVEAFDTGPFVAERSRSVPPQQGVLPVPGTYQIELGETNFDITINQPCISSSQCFDEEYAGCGICEVGLLQSQGLCKPLTSYKPNGADCTKHCECGQGSRCTRDALGFGRCVSVGRTTCTDGTLLNSCTGELFCSPYGGEPQPACGGLDSIPSTVFRSPEGSVAGLSDDCNCRFGKICRGDGSCGDPTGCFTTIYGMKPGDLRTLECEMALERPDSVIRDISANIQLRTVFRKRFQIDETLQFLSLEEFRRQETIGRLQGGAQSFSASDQNIRVSVDYSKPLPFVAGDNVLMQLDIASVGGGTVFTLNPSDIIIGQPGDKVKCNIETPLRSDRGTFAPITCEIEIGQVNVLENYPLTINVYYDYEIRSQLSVPVEKI